MSLEVDTFELVNKIEENLYLGCIDVAESIQTLTSLDIKYVLSVCDQKVNRCSESITYMQISIDDWFTEDILSHIPKANEFIAEAQQSGKNVLVHCAMGVSRSSSIVIAYIMNKYKMSFESARDLVKKGRPIICPNNGFVEQLKLYEKMGFTVDNVADNPELKQILNNYENI